MAFSVIEKKSFRKSFAGCAAFLLLIAACKQPATSKYPGPLSPEASMKTFKFAEGFKAEIYATEPLVIDPVTMQFDEEGNAYVVGMLDAYKPDSVKGKDKIVLLKDLDQDGRADTAIVFAEGLKEASSILPWKGGLLIAAAPNIMYYKDTDGDGKADQKETIFSGFFTGNEEAQITNLSFGVDNWIYANNTGQAGEVTFNRMPGAPKLQMKGSDFRFRLDRNQFELTTGPGQFGLAIDDWGHRFFTTNSVHISQVIAPKRYLTRNAYLPGNLKTGSLNISDHDPIMFQISETPYWRQERTDRRNKDYQENHLDRVEYAREHFTAASGGTFYGGDAYGDEFYGNIFTGDVSGNLVHRDILSTTDSTPYFVALRGQQEKDKEFLSTTDTWFRPANFTVGPDGNLYVIDMYRQHIETPLSIPEDLQKDMDFNAGNTMGRIYRVVAEKNPTKWVKPNLKDASGDQLVATLSHKNQWWRITAQRLLLERQDKTVIPQVKKLFSESPDSRTRLHALYVLEGLDGLDAGIVTAALKDPAAGVRENAAILAERFTACLNPLAKLVEDSSVRVAYQATFSLGAFKDKSITALMTKTLSLHGKSKWFRAAVLSTDAGSSPELLELVIKNVASADWKNSFIKEITETIGFRNQKAQVTAVLQLASQAPPNSIQAPVVKGLTAGFQNIKEADNTAKESLKDIPKTADQDNAKALADLKAWYTATAK